MAKTSSVYKDVKIYAGGYDLSGASNELELAYAFDEVPVRAYGDECHWSLPGIPRLTATLKGNAYSDGSAESEDVLYGLLGGLDGPCTWCPLTGAAGEVGYFARALHLGLSLGGSVGDMYGFTAKLAGQNVPLLRGTVMENGTKTATGSGTARQLGAVTAQQRLFAILHVLSVSGTSPTLDVIVESDDAAGFSSPVTRATFTQKTAIGAEFVTPVAGPITDTYWRLKWTVGGTGSPSFAIVGALAIA